MNDSITQGEFSVALIFPLPYRVLLLGGVGILGWATNIHGLSLLGVDVASAMDLWTEGYPPTRLPASTYRVQGLKLLAHSLYKPVYRLFIAYTVWCFLSWTIFRAATRGDVYLVNKYGFIPGITALSVLLILVCPYNIVLKSERDKFLQ